jgi:acyl-CoA synthetase (AMP-forming)/AMP-acid ligase II
MYDFWVMDEASNREQQYAAAGLWTQDRIGDLIPHRAQRFPNRELFLFEGRRIHLDQLGLAKAKFPVEWHVLEAIPTSPTGKIQKFRLPEVVDLVTVRDARLAPKQISSTLPKGQP